MSFLQLFLQIFLDLTYNTCKNFKVYSHQGQDIFLIFTYNQGKIFLIFPITRGGGGGGTCIPGLHGESGCLAISSHTLLSQQVYQVG